MMATRTRSSLRSQRKKRGGNRIRNIVRKERDKLLLQLHNEQQLCCSIGLIMLLQYRLLENVCPSKVTAMFQNMSKCTIDAIYIISRGIHTEILICAYTHTETWHRNPAHSNVWGTYKWDHKQTHTHMCISVNCRHMTNCNIFSAMWK